MNHATMLGAMPCVGLFELSEFKADFEALNIHFEEKMTSKDKSEEA